MIDTLALWQGYFIAGTCTATDTNSYLRWNVCADFHGQGP